MSSPSLLCPNSVLLFNCYLWLTEGLKCLRTERLEEQVLGWWFSTLAAYQKSGELKKKSRLQTRAINSDSLGMDPRHLYFQKTL